MRFMIFIKALAAILVIGVMFGTAIIMKRYTGTVKDMPGAMIEKVRQDEEKLKLKADENERLDTAPGQNAYLKAVELLAEENLTEAETKLKYIVSFYPSSAPAKEARRILGEMNVDRLLDPDIADGKKTITVKRGDGYTRIIARNKTTMDSLVHLSKLSRTENNRLRIGQKLKLMPLDFRVIIDVRRKTLTIMHKAEYVKEYQIVAHDLDAAGVPNAGVQRKKLGKIRGFLLGKMLPSHHESYRASSKVIYIADSTMALRASGDDDNAGPGFYLKPEDMEELPLLLRPSNEVEIRY